MRTFGTASIAPSAALGTLLVYSFLTYNDQSHPTLNAANLGAYNASAAVSTDSWQV